MNPPKQFLPSYEISRSDLAYLADKVRHICLDAHESLGLPAPLPLVPILRKPEREPEPQPRPRVPFIGESGKPLPMKDFEWYIYSKLIWPDRKRALSIAQFLNKYYLGTRDEPRQSFKERTYAACVKVDRAMGAIGAAAKKLPASVGLNGSTKRGEI